MIEPTIYPSSCLNRLSRVDKPAQNGKGLRAGEDLHSPVALSQQSRRSVGSFVQRQNGNQERDNPAEALTNQNVSRSSIASLSAGRIASEANASGKAGGYADGGTTEWMVEVQVGVNTS